MKSNSTFQNLVLLSAAFGMVACEPLDESPGTPGEGGSALTAEEASNIHGNVLRRGNDAQQFADSTLELVIGGGL